jgi:hypothetical protein
MDTSNPIICSGVNSYSVSDTGIITTNGDQTDKERFSKR